MSFKQRMPKSDWENVFLKGGLSMDQLEKKVTEWAEENTAKAVSLLKRLIGEKARSAMNLTHRQSF